jgi:hypothetical protein
MEEYEKLREEIESVREELAGASSDGDGLTR